MVYTPALESFPQYLRDAAAFAFAIVGGNPSYSPVSENATQYLRDAAAAATLVGV